MAVNFPTSIDSLTNPSSTDTLDSPSHSDQHSDLNDAVEVLEAKVGVDSSAVATSVDYKLTNTSSSNPGHKHTLVNGATDVTSTAVELNKLDGTDAVVADFDKLHDITSTATELNQLDDVSVGGNTSGDILTTDDTQTLTNKTLTNPAINYTDTAANQNVLVRAYLNSAQTNLVNAEVTLVELDAESFDLGSDFNTTTHLFTAPVTGYYQVSSRVGFKNIVADKRYLSYIYINGTIYSVTSTFPSLAGNLYLSSSDLCYLASIHNRGLYTRSDSGDNTVDLAEH